MSAGLRWYSPCGYSTVGLFPSSGPVPACPECHFTHWSTLPFAATPPARGESLDVADDERFVLVTDPPYGIALDTSSARSTVSPE